MITPEQQREMYEMVKSLSTSVTRIETGVFGDEEAGIKGLATRVGNNESYISKDKKIKWVGVGIGIAIGWFIKLWDKI